ncbi:U-box domain-containing protein 45-like [Glycine soja]|uniref:RING-type E3 ubiquitin transferase n=1 Tax=Glycine soja TaxID=3848 RepID=A0A445FMC3_GLYSO|nr:U-box domain-containing protein 45-like [Glycine soja]XP_028214389.1 U-box domain-containing protein 45-like [Glycine soja]RZB50059.1 U-box domain-containing protein 6 isoform A [Glycine soja]RZB50060.1 U-box domain-containing protein 6 isoform B [Glycine soja]RZB50061.1 U-box domain-containing protein 6 isoform C [Glycine soja]
MRIMDVAEVEESFFAASDAKLHGEMCKCLSAIYCKILSLFPSLEAARPRSKSGIQALCSLHVALEKAKNVLQHCSECSKLYLAITGDSVLLKFEKAKCALGDSLKRVEDIVPQSIGCQIDEIVKELASTVFALDPSEKQVGDDLIALLQQGRKFSDSNDSNELECFHLAATRLGITSSRTALTERRALKKLIERARAEEDKRKESIIAFLLHLMRKYSKLFRSEFSDDNDSQGSQPCSPTVQRSLEDGIPGGHCHAFDRQLSKLSSFNFKPNNRKSGQMLLPPEELRCPISLQLMSDPVIIASGQTYERVCIEKWFRDGHNTCPKTQQKLSHLCLTPNYCVKGLVASWCEQNGVPIPEGPPESLDFNYWRLALSDTESTNSRSVNSVGSCKLKGVKVVPVEESGISEQMGGNATESFSAQEEDNEQYVSFLKVLTEGNNWKRKCKVVEQLRLLLRDDEEARIFMGANGFVEALMQFLQSAVHEANAMALEIGAMALFNLAVNNNRNKEIMISTGILSLLEEMISKTSSYGCAVALYLNLSCLDKAKHMIGTSQAVQFLIQILEAKTEVQCKIDSLHALYNLSTVPSNIPNLLSSGIMDGLQSLLVDQGDCMWTEKCIAVLINLAVYQAGREKMMLAPGLISALASTLDTGEPIEQEQAASCLLILCNRSEECCQMVLQEGVIPALVSISVNGTSRGREKAQKLLMVFREQRQRDHSPVKIDQPESESSDLSMPPPDTKPLSKTISRRKVVGKAFSFLWKSKSYSVYQC